MVIKDQSAKDTQRNETKDLEVLCALCTGNHSGNYNLRYTAFPNNNTDLQQSAKLSSKVKPRFSYAQPARE